MRHFNCPFVVALWQADVSFVSFTTLGIGNQLGTRWKSSRRTHFTRLTAGKFDVCRKMFAEKEHQGQVIKRTRRSTVPRKGLQTASRTADSRRHKVNYRSQFGRWYLLWSSIVNVRIRLISRDFDPRLHAQAKNRQRSAKERTKDAQATDFIPKIPSLFSKQFSFLNSIAIRVNDDSVFAMSCIKQTVIWPISSETHIDAYFL